MTPIHRRLKHTKREPQLRARTEALVSFSRLSTRRSARYHHSVVITITPLTKLYPWYLPVNYLIREPFLGLTNSKANAIDLPLHLTTT